MVTKGQGGWQSCRTQKSGKGSSVEKGIISYPCGLLVEGLISDGWPLTFMLLPKWKEGESYGTKYWRNIEIGGVPGW